MEETKEKSRAKWLSELTPNDYYYRLVRTFDGSTSLECMASKVEIEKKPVSSYFMYTFCRTNKTYSLLNYYPIFTSLNTIPDIIREQKITLWMERQIIRCCWKQGFNFFLTFLYQLYFVFLHLENRNKYAMQKIMFSEKYGLESAVLSKVKTKTRRVITDVNAIQILQELEADGWQNTADIQVFIEKYSRYKKGEVVAIAQAYKDLGYTKEWVEQHISPNPHAKPSDPFEKKYPGWSNKMFVPAELNKAHQICITDIKVERLQDCSDDDILKEGVFQISAPTYRHYNGIGYTFKGWTDRGVECSSDTPKGAFKALINKTCGRGTFESNPLVFAYSFKLLY